MSEKIGEISYSDVSGNIISTNTIAGFMDNISIQGYTKQLSNLSIVGTGKLQNNGKYKISIRVNGDNLFNQNGHSNFLKWTSVEGTKFISKKVQLKPNTKYVTYAKVIKSPFFKCEFKIGDVPYTSPDNNGNLANIFTVLNTTSRGAVFKTSFTTNSSGVVYLQYNENDHSIDDIDVMSWFNKIANIAIYESDIERNDFKAYEEEIVDIELPIALHGFDGKKDVLTRRTSDNRWVVRQMCLNIKPEDATIVFDGNNVSAPAVYKCKITNNEMINSGSANNQTQVLCNVMKSIAGNNTWNSNEKSVGLEYPSLKFNIPNTELVTADIAGAKTWFKDSKAEVIVRRQNVKEVLLPEDFDIKIPLFEGRTHISFIEEESANLQGRVATYNSDSDTVGKITIDCLSPSLKTFLKGLGMTEADAKTIIDNVIGSSNDLNTFDKTNVVAAINELKTKVDSAFQSASDGKVMIASAITGKGVGATASDDYITLANKIQSIVQDTAELPMKVPIWTINIGNIDCLLDTQSGQFLQFRVTKTGEIPNPNGWQTSNSFTGLLGGTSYKFEGKYGDNLISDINVTTPKANQTAPAKPVASDITQEGFTITSASGTTIQEVGTSKTYTTPYVATGRVPSSKAKFVAFKAATTQLNQSPNSPEVEVQVRGVGMNTPGPEHIILGNATKGYFGTFEMSNKKEITELLMKHKYWNTSFNWPDDKLTWAKFIKNGKYIYITTGYGLHRDHENRYLYGYLFEPYERNIGIRGPGNGTEVTVNGHKWKLRIPTMTNEPDKYLSGWGSVNYDFNEPKYPNPNGDIELVRMKQELFRGDDKGQWLACYEAGKCYVNGYNLSMMWYLYNGGESYWVNYDSLHNRLILHAVMEFVE